MFNGLILRYCLVSGRLKLHMWIPGTPSSTWEPPIPSSRPHGLTDVLSRASRLTVTELESATYSHARSDGMSCISAGFPTAIVESRETVKRSTWNDCRYGHSRPGSGSIPQYLSSTLQCITRNTPESFGGFRRPNKDALDLVKGALASLWTV